MKNAREVWDAVRAQCLNAQGKKKGDKVDLENHYLICLLLFMEKEIDGDFAEVVVA